MSHNRQDQKWVLVAGARPNFMKIAPLIRAIHAYNQNHVVHIHPYLVHTGQHYDAAMSDSFFNDLDILKPDAYLGVGSGTHGEQTGKVLIGFEKILFSEQPDLVIVVGDVNSTLACALAAVKLNISVAHVEAGLRSFDRTMPEEINRILTDAVSDYLFTPSPDGDENLAREGIASEKVILVGNIMMDTLLFNLEKAKKTNLLPRLGLQKDSYCLLTLHRPANVDNQAIFRRIVSGLIEVSEKIPILFPMHPRTRKQVSIFGMEEYFQFHDTPDMVPSDCKKGNDFKKIIHCFKPFGYLNFLNLMANARMVMTDSGGIQEETTVLDIPCITLRDTTERPITITEGTNVLVKDDPKKIIQASNRVLSGKGRKGRCPAMWDGQTAERIVRILAEGLNRR
jgi:UDP-N-acetylglucosamine 2-epimerase (non-hydrolysing)